MQLYVATYSYMVAGWPAWLAAAGGRLGWRSARPAASSAGCRLGRRSARPAATKMGRFLFIYYRF